MLSQEVDNLTKTGSNTQRAIALCVSLNPPAYAPVRSLSLKPLWDHLGERVPEDSAESSLINLTEGFRLKVSGF
jgi:hypothetical protein